MRLVLDLRKVSSHSERCRLASDADQHGIWGTVVTGPPGAECVEAAAIAAVTSNLSIIVDVDGDAAHPTTLAEEVAVLDQISRRRAASRSTPTPSAISKAWRRVPFSKFTVSAPGFGTASADFSAAVLRARCAPRNGTSWPPSCSPC